MKINVNVRFPQESEALQKIGAAVQSLLTAASDLNAGHHMLVQMMGVYHNGLIERLTTLEELLSNPASPIPQLIADLRAQVEANTAVDLSAIQLLNGLSERLHTALSTGDIEQVRTFLAEMDRTKNALAAAVAANTPADPGAGTGSGGSGETGGTPEGGTAAPVTA